MGALALHVSVVSHCKLWGILLGLFAIIGCQTGHDSDSEFEVAEASEEDVIALPAASQKRIRTYFEQMHASGRFSGCVLVYKNGALDSFSLGHANHEAKTPLRINSQFQLASLSKPLTAIAVMKLISDGRLALADSVSMHLPCNPFNDVTIEQLLTHTSGIGYYAYVTDSLWGMPDNYMSNADLATMFECDEIPRYFRPGRGFDYCNTNYTLLADIIEAAAGVPYSEFMQNEVFAPLGMEETVVLNAFDKTPEEYTTRGHFASNRCMPSSYLDGVVGDKGIYSTVGDLFKLYQHFDSMPLVGAKLWESARQKQVRTSKTDGYGYGWRTSPTANGDTIIYHNGWWRGFRSYFWTANRQDKLVVVLTNSLRGGYLNRDEIWSLL